MKRYTVTIKDPILLTPKRVIVFAESESEAKQSFKDLYKDYVTFTVMSVKEDLNGD